MLKTVSSIVNAIGALNYKGTWNATTNTPALASGVGTKGDYYVVSVAGSTNLDGETLWGVGDWAVYNGTAWQRLEGGSTINATTITASGTIGGGSTIGVGAATPSTSGAGITFPATQSASTDANTLDDYEEGTWTPLLFDTTNSAAEGQTYGATNGGTYTKIGRVVYITGRLTMTSLGTLNTAQRANIGGLPFTSAANVYGALSVPYAGGIALATAGQSIAMYVSANTTRIAVDTWTATTGTSETTVGVISATGDLFFAGFYIV